MSIRFRWFAAGLVLIATTAVGLYVATRASPAPQLPLLRTDAGHDSRIVDSTGRQVLLRGVDVNSLGDYWKGSRFRTVFPFRGGDVAVIRSVGWDAVRLVINWSEIEPQPGRYNDSYLRRVSGIVHELATAHVYTILDMHQDAWSATLAARPGEQCTPPFQPNLGWDGAPGWATLGSGQPHCYIGSREQSPAVQRSWQEFYVDAPGPGGVGIETQFTSMWAHVASLFARTTAVAGFEILNEPLLPEPPDNASLTNLYERTFQSIRRAEKVHSGLRHIVMFEPPPGFDSPASANLSPFANDGDVAYAPHIYTGTFPSLSPPNPARFGTAAAQAARLGGLPVINGEWGGRPRSRELIDPQFYETSQSLDDRYQFSSQYWLYKSSCGDPHEVLARATHAAGLYEVNCQNNRVMGLRTPLVRALSRPYPSAVTGTINSIYFDPSTRHFTLSYHSSHKSGLTEIAVPPRLFPDSYHESVNGAMVRSSKGSSTLLLHDCSGAKAVTVDIVGGARPTEQTCHLATDPKRGT